MAEIEEGKSYEVACPFVMTTYAEYDEDGRSTSLSWRPGIEWRDVYPDNSEAVAHGVGKVIYSVVSIHKLPRPYPPRVFFTRKFTSPDGRTFGKHRLHMLTREAFARRISGYRPGGIERADDIVIAPLSEAEKRELLERAA